MKHRELLQIGEERLSKAGIIEAKNDAWLLFEFTFKLSRHEYYLKMNEPSDEFTGSTYLDYIEKRCKHIPLQHITGTQDFMGMTFVVNSDVLIPRQDTELLVEKALQLIKEISTDKNTEDINVLDMCTGSGCIAISIEKLTNVNVTAVDISEKALEVAKRNAALNTAKRLTFVRSDLFFEFTANNTRNLCGQYDMIVSNPPYIPTEDIEELMEEVKVHEPRLALDGTEDGLLFYRRISNEALDFIRPGGYLIYEIGHNQGDDVAKIMMENGYGDVKVYKDYAGLDRVVVGCRV